MSQNDLAEALAVSRQSVSKWETDGAIPDLDKLVSLSELFGITLDELIKGTAPQARMQQADDPAADAVPAKEKAPVRAPHRLAGVILLCFGALIVLLFLFLGGGLFSLVYASPFLSCGVICLLTQQRTGLWCGWAAYGCVDLYLRYATGITWSIILLTAQFTPEMNYIRLAIGWAQFLAGLLLIALTLRSYRKKTAACDKKHIASAVVGLLALVGLTFAQDGILRWSLSRPNSQESLYQGLSFWANFCADFIRLWLLVALLVLGAALLRQRRADKRA